MAKQLLFSDQARNKLLSGVNQLAKAVITTLGPRGRNVALDKKWGAPAVVHDGVSVAKEIELKDPFENMGAQLVKEAASKTNDIAGDGTTTATVLAQTIVSSGMKNITAGANPMLIKHGIEKAVEALVTELKRIAKDVKPEDWESVATISAGDQKIGKKIAEALKLVGRDGLVEVEEGKGFEIEIDHKEGMAFDKGYASPYFSTNADTMESEISDAYILITDQKVSSISDLLPFLEKFVKVSKNLVIVADEVEGEALATLVVNKMRGSFISEDAGRKLDSVTVEDLGRADKVVADKDNTRIIGGGGAKTAIQTRIQSIRSEVERTTSDFDKEKLLERLAKLSGGVAVISVGAATEVELKELQERVKDAVEATKAAIEEGIVPGGGVALLRSAKVLDKLAVSGNDEKVGVDIMRDACQQPLRWLAANSGMDAGWVVRKVADSAVADYGFDALTLDFGSMLKKGIIDPVKVTRTALQNAASVGSMILTTEALVTDIPEKKDDKSSTPDMSGMDM